MIYFGDWSDYGYQYIAKKMLEDGDKEMMGLSFKSIELLSKHMISMYHDTAKVASLYYQETDHYIYITPQLFENFISTFRKLFERRALKLMKHRNRFKCGLDGLERTQKFTEAKQEELSKQSPILV